MTTKVDHPFGRIIVAIVVIIGLASAQASAQELTPTNLDTAQASAFVGDWVLTMELQGQQVEVEFQIQDVGGKLGAIVVIPQLPDPIVATDIVKTASGIDLSFPLVFGGQTIDLTMNLTHKLSGHLSDEGGLISADLEGIRAAPTTVATAPLKASDMDTSTMGSYIGTWDLAMDIGGRPFSVVLQFVDIDGKVAALFKSPFSPQPETISDITMSEEGARLSFDAVMAGQSAPIEVWITRISDTLDGSFSAMGGALKADFVGSRTDKDLLAALTSMDEKTRRRSRGGGTRQADIKIDGNKIRVRYTAIKEDSPALVKLNSLEDGTVFTYTDGRTIKLFSDADIIFGDTLLKAENAAPDYPGVYSLWIKKTGDAWSLVANRHADILGSQYDSTADVAEFSIAASDAEEDIGPMVVELEKTGNGGVLKIMWGSTVLTAPFTLGEHTIAKAN